MKKISLKIIAIICCIALAAGLLAGCSAKPGDAAASNAAKTQAASPAVQTAAQTSAQTTAAKAPEPVKLTYISGDAGRINKADNPVVKKIEELANVKLEITLVPNAEVKNKFNLLVASNSVPDISRLAGYDFYDYIPQGVFYDITSLVDKYGTNVKKNIPQNVWDKVRVNGKIYAIPNYNWPGKYNFNIRQDWLDNLGIKAPTSQDELSDMLKKFTYNDPDKNGKNDTYGITTDVDVTKIINNTFMVIFGAFGMQPGQYYEKDGKVFTPNITPEYKAAIEYIKKLYSDDKVVDPDLFIIKADQAKQNLVQGRAGSFSSWWSIPQQHLMDQMKMKSVCPTAKWVVCPPIKGKNGDYGFQSQGVLSAAACISSKCKNPEAAFKFLDYLNSDEGAMLASFGIKDVHYTAKDGKFQKRTDEGNKAYNEKWIDVLSQTVVRVDLVMSAYEVNNPDYWPFAIGGRDAKLYFNLFEGITTPESQKYNSDLEKLELEWLVKFVTGKEPISKFDEYAKAWKDKGGKEVMDSYIKEYNKRTGKNLTAGN